VPARSCSFVLQATTSQDGEEFFTHYFKSGCHPRDIPDIIVRAIHEKTKFYVSEAAQALMINAVDKPRTVKQVRANACYWWT
jgi:hypothetical protein